MVIHKTNFLDKIKHLNTSGHFFEKQHSDGNKDIIFFTNFNVRS